MLDQRGTQFINLDNPMKYFDVSVLANIAAQIVKYQNTIGAKKIELISLEDNTWEDTDNERYDIWLRIYDSEGGVYNQKCLFLKGKLVMPGEFHKRYKEYYPDHAKYAGYESEPEGI